LVPLNVRRYSRGIALTEIVITELNYIFTCLLIFKGLMAILVQG